MPPRSSGDPTPTGAMRSPEPWPDGWTLAVCGLATAALLATDWVHAHWLVARPERIAAGEVWRLVTGALVAGSFHELLADLALLALASVAMGGGWSARRGLLLALALCLPTAVVLVMRPDGNAHYGLAGTAHAIGFAAVGQRIRNLGPGLWRRWPLLLATAAWAALLSLHVAGVSLAAGASPLLEASRASACLAGGAVGLTASFVLGRPRSPEPCAVPGGATRWALLGLALFLTLPRVSEAANRSMVLAAHRDGGQPYALDTALPRLTCGPRTLCWYLERQLGQPCDPDIAAKHIWRHTHGTDIRRLARELSRRAGRPYDAVQLAPDRLACVVRCQPPIALVDVGWRGRKSHFVVVLEASRHQLLWYDVNRGRRRASPRAFSRAWRAYDFRVVVARRCLRRCPVSLTPARSR